MTREPKIIQGQLLVMRRIMLKTVLRIGVTHYLLLFRTIMHDGLDRRYFLALVYSTILQLVQSHLGAAGAINPAIMF